MKRRGKLILSLSLAVCSLFGFSAVADAAAWTELGSGISGCAYYPDLAIKPSTNRPFVACYGGSTVKAYSYNGSTWTQVGSDVGTGQSASTNYSPIAFNPSTNEPWYC